MKLGFTLGLVMYWAVAVVAHDYPLPPNWDKPKPRRPNPHPNPKATGVLSYRSDDSSRADMLVGINCIDSGHCGACETDITSIQTITDQIDDDGAWKDGELVACAQCRRCNDCLNTDRNGLCVFTNNMKADEDITGRQIKTLLKELRDHGCNPCGSIPIHPGNSIKTGELTVNVVSMGCGEKIC